MTRRILRDDQWERIEHLLPGKSGDRGRTAADNRLFVEAVLWVARTGCPWRDLPDELGVWNSVYVRFARWSNNGVWARVFAVLAMDADFEEIFVDSTIVRAHQHAAGAPKKRGAGPGPLARRIDHEDSRSGRRPGPVGALDADRRANARCHTSRGTDRWNRNAGRRGGQGVRCRSADRTHHEDRRECGYPTSGKPETEAGLRRASVQASQPDREIFLPYQTVSSNCHTLRQACQPLLLVCRSDRRFRMADINVNRP